MEKIDNLEKIKMFEKHKAIVIREIEKTSIQFSLIILFVQIVIFNWESRVDFSFWAIILYLVVLLVDFSLLREIMVMGMDNWLKRYEGEDDKELRILGIVT